MNPFALLTSGPRPALLAASLAAAAALPAQAYDYPTTERVNYVLTCMRDHPGPQYEMVSKCSCAVDAMASKVKLEDFVEMNTATNANTIGGERGSYIRDVPKLQEDIRNYRKLQADVQKSCFIADAAAR